MRALYVYPHPDDESFGVAHAMHKQRREGHEVHLLRFTRGGATRQRHKLDCSIEKMGKVRARAMEDVRDVLGLSILPVLDFPDSGLKEVDPRELETVIGDALTRLRPHVIVSYPVHGVSGFHDHLIAHAVVRSVFVELKGTGNAIPRLAFSTVTEELAKKSTVFQVSHSSSEEIDCLVATEAEDIEAGRRALDCYVTFQETIDRAGIKDSLPPKVAFEFFQEAYDPPVGDLFHGLT